MNDKASVGLWLRRSCTQLPLLLLVARYEIASRLRLDGDVLWHGPHDGVDDQHHYPVGAAGGNRDGHGDEYPLQNYRRRRWTDHRWRLPRAIRSPLIIQTPRGPISGPLLPNAIAFNYIFLTALGISLVGVLVTLLVNSRAGEIEVYEPVEEGAAASLSG